MRVMFISKKLVSKIKIIFAYNEEVKAIPMALIFLIRIFGDGS